MSFFKSRALLIGKSLAVKDWERPSIIMKARRLAHEGATLAELAAALNWNVGLQTVRRRLRKKNIVPLNRSDRCHMGFETHFPDDECVNQVSFAPTHRRRA